MLALSAALVMVLLSVTFTARPIYRRYRAWRYPPEYRMIIYDVQDLVLSPPDFCDPSLNDPSPPAVRLGLAPSPHASWPRLTAADLLKAIRERIGPGNWPKDETVIEERNGKLVIVQTQEAHREISALLNEARAQYRQSVEIEALFVKGPGLGKLLDEQEIAPGEPLAPGRARELAAAARARDAQVIRPRDFHLEHASPRRMKAPRVRCFNRQVLRLTAVQTRDYLPAGGEPAKRVVTGFALDARPVFSRGGNEVRLHLRPAYCAPLPSEAGMPSIPALDERRLWTAVTLPGGGWTALLLETVDTGGGELDPVLVLVGARCLASEPFERRRF